MSVSIKYKGAEIASASTEVTKTIKTAGKYCEADILVENTPDGGDAPVINPLSVTANGTYTAPSGVDGYSPVTVNVPQGITPTGNISITDTNVTDVTNYATAQVVDADLVAANIKEGVNILGILGTFAGGGSLPSSISKIDGGSFTFASATRCNAHYINHNLGEIPKGFFIWSSLTKHEDGTNRILQSVMSVRRTLLKQDDSVFSLGTDYYSVFTWDGVPQNSTSNYNTQAKIDAEYSSTTIRFNYDISCYQSDTTYYWYAWV